MSNLLDKDAANCAWSDYRKEYGVNVNGSVRALEHKAFHAGWDAALAELGDVIVIPRADLPKVHVNGEGDRIATPDASWPMVSARRVGATGFRNDALSNLALAEYLDAHPPVDEAQVDALAGLIATEGLMPTGLSYNDVARRLIATGRVTVTGADK